MESLSKSKLIETVCHLALHDEYRRLPSNDSELENSIAQEAPQWLTELSQQITEDVTLDVENKKFKLEKYRIKSDRLLKIEEVRAKVKISEHRCSAIQLVSMWFTIGLTAAILFFQLAHY